MNIGQFWDLIGESRKESSGNNEAFLEIISGKVSLLGLGETTEFRSFLGIYVEIASECVWLNMACKVINGYVSDDTGLYFGLWVIAQGKDVFFNALKNPDSLAALENIPFGNADFEMLMSVGYEEDETAYADEALQEKTAALAEAIEKETEFRDGGMYGGYESFEDAMEDIPNVLPNLIKRAESENFDWKNYI